MVSQSCKRTVSPKPWPRTIPRFTRQEPCILALASAGFSTDHSPPPRLSFEVTIATPYGSPWVRNSATQQPRLCLQNTKSGIGFPTTSRVPRVSGQLTAHLAPAMMPSSVPGTQRMPVSELLHSLLPIRGCSSCMAPPWVSATKSFPGVSDF